MKNINTVHGMTALPAQLQQARTSGHVQSVKRVGAYAMLAILSAYALQLINPAGVINVQEKNIIVVVFALTLLVVVPIIALTIYLVSRHRSSSTTVEYPSLRSQSLKKEAVAWSVPIVIVVLFAFLGWGVTYSLDVYKPIESKVAQRVATVAGK